MEKYRRPDQEYFDDFDRHAIPRLKQILMLEFKELKRLRPDELYMEKLRRAINGTSFDEIAIQNARTRTAYIRQKKEEDEKLDRMVASTREPEAPRCNTCLTIMQVCHHFDDAIKHQLEFVFECPNQDSRKRVLYTDGTEKHYPEPTCEKCGGKIRTSKKKIKGETIITDTCWKCGHKEVLEIPEIKDEPINEEERKYYCLDYLHRQSFTESLIRLAELGQEIEEANKKRAVQEILEVDKIQKLTVFQVQERLNKAAEDNNFGHIHTDPPDMKDLVIINFTLQDKTNRKEEEAIEQFKNALNESLLFSNWRLKKQSLTYRMGCLSGKLVGYERESDIIAIATEIYNESKKKPKETNEQE